MNKLQFSIAALLASSSTIIQAADEALSPVIVTATRTAQSADESLASVTVITREEIEQSQSNSVVELLQSRTIGVELTRNGGLGTVTSLLMRGTNSNHVLVLIDGVRVNSTIDGDFKWANLPLEQVERIEVVRGPRSTLYGSDAIGGVVQIFTRKGKGIHASVGGGSYNTRRSSLGASGTLGDGQYHINAGYLQSDSFSAARPGTWGYDPDNDGYKNTNLGAGISHPLGDNGKLSLNLLHSNGELDTDSGPSSSSTQRNDSANLGIDWSGSDNWQQTISLGRAEDHYETSSAYIVHSLRDSVGWQHDLQLSDNGLLTAGLDYTAENGKSEGVSGYDEKVTNKALFAQYQWHDDQFDLLLGGRADDNSGFERYNTGNITLGSKLGNGRFYLSYANAFKAPTFLQRYYPGTGNPDLEPEKAKSGELGYRFNALQVSLYDTRIENLIQWDPAGYQNISRAHIQGLELEYAQQLGSWQLNSGVTLQKAEDEESSAPLTRRAEKKLFFTANGPLNSRSDLGIELSYTGPRPDGSVELTSYTLVNLTSEYRFSKEWSLSGRIENLLDEEYMLANGYNTPGASAYANINFKM